VATSSQTKTEKAEARKKAAAARAARARATVNKIPKPQVRSKAEGFADFIRKQGVIGLAVGLAIGTQASELVKNIVSSVITPIVDLLVGKGGLKDLDLFVQIGDRTATFDFGLLIDSSIKFLAVALVIYFVIMGLRLDKLDKKKD
jgi:large conductance mechanosensitive channel